MWKCPARKQSFMFKGSLGGREKKKKSGKALVEKLPRIRVLLTKNRSSDTWSFNFRTCTWVVPVRNVLAQEWEPQRSCESPWYAFMYPLNAEAINSVRFISSNWTWDELQFSFLSQKPFESAFLAHRRGSGKKPIKFIRYSADLINLYTTTFWYCLLTIFISDRGPNRVWSCPALFCAFGRVDVFCLCLANARRIRCSSERRRGSFRGATASTAVPQVAQQKLRSLLTQHPIKSNQYRIQHTRTPRSSSTPELCWHRESIYYPLIPSELNHRIIT